MSPNEPGCNSRHLTSKRKEWRHKTAINVMNKGENKIPPFLNALGKNKIPLAMKLL